MSRAAIVIPPFLTPRPDPKLPEEIRGREVDMSFKIGRLFWEAAPGDALKQGQTVAVAEVEKMSVDIPAPADGLLAEICVGEEAMFFPGDVLGYIETTEESA